MLNFEKIEKSRILYKNVMLIKRRIKIKVFSDSLLVGPRFLVLFHPITYIFINMHNKVEKIIM